MDANRDRIEPVYEHFEEKNVLTTLIFIANRTMEGVRFRTDTIRLVYTYNRVSIKRSKCSSVVCLLLDGSKIIFTAALSFIYLCMGCREFWRRHKRKVYVSLGLCGSGYLLYKFYDSYTKRISELERQLADEQENDELLKAQ